MNSEVRRLIDDHLDAIDSALADSGASRSERRNVTDDIESQVLQMLGDGEAEPTVADIEAILAELDPPEAYAPESWSGPRAPVEAPSARFSRAAVYGAAWAGFSLMAVFLWYNASIDAEWLRYILIVLVLVPGVTAPIGTTVLGLISIGQIRHSAGGLYGLPLALGDALLFPLLALDAVIYIFAEQIRELIDGGNIFSGPSQAYLLPIVAIATPVLIVAADVLVAYWACKAATRPAVCSDRAVSERTGPPGSPQAAGVEDDPAR